jgi:leucyl aminopeptidase
MHGCRSQFSTSTTTESSELPGYPEDTLIARFKAQGVVAPLQFAQAAAAESPVEHAELTVKFVTVEDTETQLGAETGAPADFKGKAGQSVALHHTNTLLVGLGKAAKVTTGTYRKAAHTAVATANARKLKHISISVDTNEPTPLEYDTVVELVARTSILSNYHFDKYLTKDNSKSFLDTITFVHPQTTTPTATEVATEAAEPVILSQLSENATDLTAKLSVAATLSGSTLLTRDLVNDQPDTVSPQYMEDLARGLAESSEDISITVLDHNELIEQGYHLLTAVGQACREKARLIALEYKPQSQATSTAPIALVGKGITFDTGGLNLKPTGFIETMHMDMGGSGAVLGAFKAISSLQMDAHVVAVVAIAENAIDKDSFKPFAIIPSAKGFVQIGNTDAEGRLALADALTYVQKHHTPTTVIDVATLTGACVVALGEYSAGIFTNDNTIKDTLVTAGEATDEICWPLPIHEGHIEELKCSIADFSSTGAGRYGGASTAAAFLQKFIEKDVKWAHVDIAGPAMASKARGHVCEGGTGFGAQLLTETVARLSTTEK